MLDASRRASRTLSTDPLFIEKLRDVVGLYLSAPDNALVLCVDEKNQCQALEHTQPMLPLGRGYVEGVTHDYVRHGTTTLFAALNVLNGTVLAQCKPRHRHQEGVPAHDRQVGACEARHPLHCRQLRHALAPEGVCRIAVRRQELERPVTGTCRDGSPLADCGWSEVRDGERWRSGRCQVSPRPICRSARTPVSRWEQAGGRSRPCRS